MRKRAVAVLGVTILTTLMGLALVGGPADAPGVEPAELAGAQPEPRGRGPKPPGALMRAREHRDEMLRHQAERAAAEGAGAQPTGIDSSSWKLLGPPDVAGRVRSILIHPVLDDAMLVGAATGGVWRTLNGGQSWVPSDDFMASVTIGCMAMDPITPTTVYAGTGEGFFDAKQGSSNTAAIQGEGIFKSGNFGVSWVLLASTAANPDFQFVNRIAVGPTTASHNTVLAATGAGIFRSTDGGNSWTKVHGTRVLDVKFHPSDATRAVASERAVPSEADGRALYSSDGGQTWQAAVGGPADDNRIELAWARSVPNKVYAASHIHPDGLYVSVSVDFGETYVQVTDTDRQDLDSFGDYAMTLWVDPTDDERLLLGATYLYRSSDGGITFDQLATGHDDHHVLIEHPDYGVLATNRVLFNGSDGGVYGYDDPFAEDPTITNLNDTLVVTQFYGADIHPSGVIVGGTQDNGTLVYDPQAQQWSNVLGADGGFSAIDAANPNRMYFQMQGLQVFRSDDAGASVMQIFDPEDPDADPDTVEPDPNFVAPLELDPAPGTSRLYVGALSLWRTASASGFPPDWHAIKDPIPTCPPPDHLESAADAPPSHQTDNPPCNISTIAISPKNPGWLLVGYNNGEVWSTTSGGFGWERRDDNPGPLPDRWCSDVVADPHDQDRAYVSFMGYANDSVWKTDDFGATWTDIGAGLPALPVNGLAVHPLLPGWLYAATDLGVYSSVDDGATWSASNVGPSNVSVDELAFRNNKTLMAATHGRGVWIVDTYPDCNGNMIPDWTDIVSGFSNDQNFNSIPDECETGPPPGKLDPTTGPIKLAKVGGDVVIHCSGSCSPGAIGYGIYEGTIGSWYSHKAVAGLCQATCPGAVRVTPSVDDAYYLVVPHNLRVEGSYGTALDTARVQTERPRPAPVTDRCAEFQMITACP